MTALVVATMVSMISINTFAQNNRRGETVQRSENRAATNQSRYSNGKTPDTYKAQCDERNQGPKAQPAQAKPAQHAQVRQEPTPIHKDVRHDRVVRPAHKPGFFVEPAPAVVVAPAPAPVVVAPAAGIDVNVGNVHVSVAL